MIIGNLLIIAALAVLGWLALVAAFAAAPGVAVVGLLMVGWYALAVPSHHHADL